MKNILKRLFLITAVIAAVWGIARYTGLHNYLSFEYLKTNRQVIHDLVDRQWGLVALLFIALQIIVVASALPLSAMLTVAGGFMFGTIASLIFTVIGGTLGAGISFIMIKYVIGSIITNRYHHRITQWKEKAQKHGAYYVLILHFFMVVPFFIINSIAAFINISLKQFLLMTALGVIPGAFFYSLLGNQLMEINSIADFFEFKTLVLIGLSIVFVCSLLFSKRVLKKIT